MVFLEKKKKKETLKAEKAVRSGDNQLEPEMPVSELAPTLASWDGSQPAAFGRERGEGGNGYTTGGLALRPSSQ